MLRETKDNFKKWESREYQKGLGRYQKEANV